MYIQKEVIGFLSLLRSSITLWNQLFKLTIWCSKQSICQDYLAIGKRSDSRSSYSLPPTLFSRVLEYMVFLLNQSPIHHRLFQVSVLSS